MEIANYMVFRRGGTAIPELETSIPEQGTA